MPELGKRPHFSTLFLPRYHKAVGEIVGHTLLASHVQVSIDVGCHLDIRVAQSFLHIFQSEAIVEKQTCAAMAQLMEANMRQIVLFQQGRKPVRYIVR